MAGPRPTTACAARRGSPTGGKTARSPSKRASPVNVASGNCTSTSPSRGRLACIVARYGCDLDELEAAQVERLRASRSASPVYKARQHIADDTDVELTPLHRTLSYSQTTWYSKWQRQLRQRCGRCLVTCEVQSDHHALFLAMLEDYCGAATHNNIPAVSTSPSIGRCQRTASAQRLTPSLTAECRYQDDGRSCLSWQPSTATPSPDPAHQQQPLQPVATSTHPEVQEWAATSLGAPPEHRPASDWLAERLRPVPLPLSEARRAEVHDRLHSGRMAHDLRTSRDGPVQRPSTAPVRVHCSAEVRAWLALLVIWVPMRYPCMTK